MDDKLENLLISLDDEIERKCLDLKKQQQEKTNIRLFTYICTLFICIPIVLLFVGINILLFAVPIILFLAVNLFVLAPFVLNNNMGGAIQ